MAVSAIILVVLSAILTICLGQNYGRPPVERIKPGSIQSICGSSHTLPSRGMPTVLVFATTDCPIAGRMAPYFVKVVEKNLNIPFFVVMPAASRSEDIESWRSRTGMPSAVVMVKDDRWRRQLKVDVVPTAVIVGADGSVQYYGQINDLYRSHSVPRPSPSRNDLQIALEEVLGGKKVSLPYIPAVGCFID